MKGNVRRKGKKDLESIVYRSVLWVPHSLKVEGVAWILITINLSPDLRPNYFQ